MPAKARARALYEVVSASPGLSLEREPEHELSDSHEPGLNGGLAEVCVAEGVRRLQRAQVRTVEHVQELECHLARLASGKPEVLDEFSVHVVLRRRAHVGD